MSTTDKSVTYFVRTEDGYSAEIEGTSCTWDDHERTVAIWNGDSFAFLAPMERVVTIEARR